MWNLPYKFVFSKRCLFQGDKSGKFLDHKKTALSMPAECNGFKVCKPCHGKFTDIFQLCFYQRNLSEEIDATEIVPVYFEICVRMVVKGYMFHLASAVCVNDFTMIPHEIIKCNQTVSLQGIPGGGRYPEHGFPMEYRKSGFILVQCPVMFQAASCR